MFRQRNMLILAVVGVMVLGVAVLAGADRNTLAIFNLTPSNLEAMGYDSEILYALLSALEREKSVELLPRREMEEILSHAGLVQGGDLEAVAKAGKALGINFVLFGNVAKKAGPILAQLKLMDVQNKRLIKTWDKSFAGREAILNEIPAFAKELSSTIINSKQAQAVSAVAPVPPEVDIQNLRAKREGEKVILTWKFDPSQPISGFNVYRSEHSEGPYQFHGKTNQNLFDDTQVNKGKSYYYRIGIILSSGSELKSSLTAQIKSAGEKIPHPPLVMSGQGYVRRAEIKFVPSLQNDQEQFKIEGYKVYRKKSSGDSWQNISSIPAKIESQSELAFNVEDSKNLEDGETYLYAVSSLDNQKSESPLSDAVTVKTIQRPALTLEKDNLLRKISVAWKPQEGITGYYLYRKRAQEDWQNVAKIKGDSESRHTDDKGLQDGQPYQYRLTVYDAKAESGPSKAIQAKTKDLPPCPQDAIAQSGLVKSVKIFWTPLDDPDVGGYAIYRGTSAGDLKRVAKVNGYQSYSYLDKGAGYEPLEDGRDYFYAIVSYNLFGTDGEPAKAVKATTKPKPTPVKGLIATKESDFIQIKWHKNPEPEIKAYSLFRSRSGGSWSILKNLDSNQTSFKDIDLKPETDYRYRIIVQDNDGLESDPVESEVVASPIAKPKK